MENKTKKIKKIKHDGRKRIQYCINLLEYIFKIKILNKLSIYTNT